MASTCSKAAGPTIPRAILALPNGAPTIADRALGFPKWRPTIPTHEPRLAPQWVHSPKPRAPTNPPPRIPGDDLAIPPNGYPGSGIPFSPQAVRTNYFEMALSRTTNHARNTSCSQLTSVRYVRTSPATPKPSATTEQWDSIRASLGLDKEGRIHIAPNLPHIHTRGATASATTDVLHPKRTSCRCQNPNHRPSATSARTLAL